ncbi:MAG: helix-turn-helix domain-containing protein [Methanobacteriaceae archaeon]|nr:helix-turn-helix domain-containing protein [Methanobacteriaceae archaeon]
MVSVIKKEIEDHIGLDGVKKEIKKRKVDAIVMQRLIFIQSMFEHEDVQKASKVVGVAPSTGYEWLKRWNAEGINGLTPKYDGGKPSKLSKEDYKKLDKLFYETENLTTDLAHEIVKTNFNIDFSQRHIQRILKRLKYTYTKPYMIYAKIPEDAEDQLKKKLKK